MEHLTIDMRNILLIVEGKKTEPSFFKCLRQKFNIEYKIYCLGTNIYTLYSKIKELDFNCDIKSVLKDLHPEQAQILNNKFAYTYLIFDCDAHHPKKEDNREIKKIVIDNFRKIGELLNYFNDETEPSKGKLYINYPMMESYKDADDFYDLQYKDASVCLDDISNYKALVGKKKLSNRRVDSFTKEELSKLSLMNIFKLNYIVNSHWSVLSYGDYKAIMETLSLYEAEKQKVNKYNEISVINTTLFLILDYYGNRDGFYDAIIGIKNK